MFCDFAFLVAKTNKLGLVVLRCHPEAGPAVAGPRDLTRGPAHTTYVTYYLGRGHSPSSQARDDNRRDARKRFPPESMSVADPQSFAERKPSGPLVQRHELSANRFADVFTERPIETVVFQLFKHVRTPAGATCNREHRGKQIGRNA